MNFKEWLANEISFVTPYQKKAISNSGNFLRDLGKNAVKYAGGELSNTISNSFDKIGVGQSGPVINIGQYNSRENDPVVGVQFQFSIDTEEMKNPDEINNHISQAVSNSEEGLELIRHNIIDPKRIRITISNKNPDAISGIAFYPVKAESRSKVLGLKPKHYRIMHQSDYHSDI